jgi:hypothetical protein
LNGVCAIYCVLAHTHIFYLRANAMANQLPPSPSRASPGGDNWYRDYRKNLLDRVHASLGSNMPMPIYADDELAATFSAIAAIDSCVVDSDWKADARESMNRFCQRNAGNHHAAHSMVAAIGALAKLYSNDMAGFVRK